MKKGKSNGAKAEPKLSEDEIQEEVLLFFSRENDLEKVRDSFGNSLGLPTGEESPFAAGGTVELENEDSSVKITILQSSMGEQEKKIISDQKNGACGYFAQVEGGSDDIKINLCHHIQQCNTFVYMSLKAASAGIDLQKNVDELVGVVLEVMEEVDGVLIERWITARNSDDNVSLSGEGQSEVDSYFPFELGEAPEYLSGCTERQLARRHENMKYLFDKEIFVCELPLNEDDEKATIRSKEEVARRMLGLLIISLYSESMMNPDENLSVEEARKFIGQVMEDLSLDNLEEILTPEEIAYVQDDNPDEKTKINYCWCYEPLYILEWVLGLVEGQDPVEICDVGLMVRNLHAFESLEEICAKTQMRSTKEILDKADLIYRMDWAAVDARIHGFSGPGGIDHGVVQERHKALNWIIGFDGADWDDVTTPT